MCGRGCAEQQGEGEQAAADPGTTPPQRIQPRMAALRFMADGWSPARRQQIARDSECLLNRQYSLQQKVFQQIGLSMDKVGHQPGQVISKRVVVIRKSQVSDVVELISVMSNC